MYKDKKMIYIKALSPIHAGSGQEIGFVDMPIQREKHSNIPKIEASTLKGCIKYNLYSKFKGKQKNIKELIEKLYKSKGCIKYNLYSKFKGEPKNIKKLIEKLYESKGCIKYNLYSKFKEEQKNIEELYDIFGSEDGNDHASLIGFTDAKLLFLPMRSTDDIFKLVTCPYIIKRWLEDLKLQDYHKDIIEKLDLDKDINEGECLSYFDNHSKKNIILEEYIFNNEKMDEELAKIFNCICELNINKVVIINDLEFVDMVTMYTEIITRNQIDINTGVAKNTGLFTEEYLPSETILYFTVLSSPNFNRKKSYSSEKVLKYFNNNLNKVFQIGANATIGKGFVKILDFSEGNNKNKKETK